MAIKSPDSEA